VFDLTSPKLSDLIECGHAVRRQGRSAACMEEAAQRVVQLLHRSVRDAQGRPACVLVRLFKTHPLATLPADLKRDALERISADSGSLWAVRCLTLLGTAGDQLAWNDRHASAGHRAIPLPGPEGLARAPMIAQLIRQLGLDAGTVLRPDPALILDLEQRSFNVFHIPEVRGSPYVPAQDEFVAQYGVRSVLGFGGLLPGGDLFAVILFSRVAIARDTADLFRPMALCVKLAVLPFATGPVFQGEPVRAGSAGDIEAAFCSRLAALEQLLTVQEATALGQTRRLEQTTADLRRFKFLSDHANDSHLFLDEQGRILYANVTACAWLGYTAAQLCNLTVPDIDPNADSERFRSVFRAAQTGRLPPFESLWKRKDGSTFTVEVGATAVSYLGQKYLLSVVRDITERRTAEEARIASERLYRRLTEGASTPSSWPTRKAASPCSTRPPSACSASRKRRPSAARSRCS
jgi:PAS domain S-box-containing protein